MSFCETMTSETVRALVRAQVFYNKVFEIEAYLKDKAFRKLYPPQNGRDDVARREKNLPQTGRFFPDVRSRDGTCRDRIAAAVNNRIIVYCDRDTKLPAAIPERERISLGW